MTDLTVSRHNGRRNDIGLTAASGCMDFDPVFRFLCDHLINRCLIAKDRYIDRRPLPDDNSSRQLIEQALTLGCKQHHNVTQRIDKAQANNCEYEGLSCRATTGKDLRIPKS